MAENITFRSHLIGSVHDFADDCDMGPLVKPSILAELIVALSRYTEEGVQLSPEIYLCEDSEIMLKFIPGYGIIKLGMATADATGVMKALKKAAPLAIGDWKIFIEISDKSFCFGLFHGDLSPLSIEVHQALLSGDVGAAKVVRIHQTGGNCVELRSFLGKKHNIYLSHKRDEEPPPGTYLDDLVSSICERVDLRIQEQVQTLLGRALRQALLRSHGTLIAVTSQAKRPKLLDDGIDLTPSIDFVNAVKDVIDHRVDAHDLRSQMALLEGMLNSDGIVVFSPYGSLLSYNCFISLPRNCHATPSGGARRRAYQAMCEKLGRGLAAAYIQSQDGWTEFKRGAP